MSKKILEVSGDATRGMEQRGSGSFYSAHEQEDVEKWLSHKNADSQDYYFNEVFGDSWWNEQSHENLDDFDVKFQEIREVEDKLLNSIKTLDDHYCQFDEEIQEFLDEESIKNKEKNNE